MAAVWGMLAAFALMAVSFMVGVAAGVRHGGVSVGGTDRKALTDDSKPICFCQHHFGEHRRNGSCASDVKRARSGGGFHWVNCTCQQYVGPVPLANTEFWAAPIATSRAAIETVYED